MKSAPSETIETLHRVRQQLILAQVRIMELEDARDGTAGTLSSTEQLLAAAQRLADQKMDEAGHLTKVHAELQTQFEYLRHMQHVTNEALNQTRSQLASSESNHTRLQHEIAVHVEQATQLSTQIAQLHEQSLRLHEQITRLSQDLVESKTTAAIRQERIDTLETDLRALKATKSWRWTAWIRAIGRALSGGKS